NLNMQRFKINDTLEKVYRRFEILGAKAGIEFSLEAQGEVLVEADEARIEQVLYNLLNNALNHSVEGGRITLSLIECKDKIKVKVEDTGEGIPENELPYIWDRF